MYVVYDTLRQLEVKDKVMITVFNKLDRIAEPVRLKDMSADYQVRISAKTDGDGLDTLMETLSQVLRSQRVYLEKTYGYHEAGKIQIIRRSGQLLSEEYAEDGIRVKAYVPAALYAEFR